LRIFTEAELGSVPVKGPFSRYLGVYETSLLVALLNSVAPKVMIEFGCNAGITAARVLENVLTIERYIGVDLPPDDKQTVLDCQRPEVPVNAGCYASHDPRFFLLAVRSQLLRTGHLEPCDAVFIDGDHSEQAVLHESRLAYRLMRGRGIIVWHDYGNTSVEVDFALNRLIAEGWPINAVEKCWLAFMRVVKVEDNATPL